MAANPIGIPNGEVVAPGRRATGLASLWRRLPVVVRAPVVALALGLAGNGPWALLALANLHYLPSVPWSVPPAAVYLWLWWRYLGGAGPPRATAEERRRRLRAGAVSTPVWRWSLWALGFHAATMSAVGLVARRFVDPTPYRFPDIPPSVSPLTMAALLIMVSVVAGVVEEATFRGYMQVPIERRHGPVVAVAVVSVVFTLAHLGSYPGMSPGFFVAFVVSVSGYSIVACLAGSILPGLVFHSAGNAAALLTWWFFRPQTLVPRFTETGADVLFWIDCLEVPVFGLLALWAYRRLARAARG